MKAKVKCEFETEDVECRGCGDNLSIPKVEPGTERSDLDLSGRFKICEKCLIAGFLWGLEKWLEAGAPGAERKQ